MENYISGMGTNKLHLFTSHPSSYTIAITDRTYFSTSDQRAVTTYSRAYAWQAILATALDQQ